MTLNSLYVYFPLVSTSAPSVFYAKRLNGPEIDPHHPSNMKWIDMMCIFEETILQTYKKMFHVTKPMSVALKTHLVNGTINVHRELARTSKCDGQYRQDYVLKVSGVWESSSTVGITYKLIQYDTFIGDYTAVKLLVAPTLIC